MSSVARAVTLAERVSSDPSSVANVQAKLFHWLDEYLYHEGGRESVDNILSMFFQLITLDGYDALDIADEMVNGTTE